MWIDKPLFLICMFLLGCLQPIPMMAQTPAEKVALLDNYIEQARQEWQIPGLAIAVVQDGKTILLKGYGQQSRTSSEPVTTETLFAAASTTKAMTAAAMGMLVDEGKVKWDDKVIDHMPDFQLADPYVTRELRVRDLFTHNAGIGNADFLWFNNDLSSKEILARMRYAEPAYPFRGGYTYQNIMYLAAGELIARLSGMPWSLFVQERLFDPIGMDQTFPDRRSAQSEPDLSVAHYEIEGEIVPIEDSNADAIAPAGAVWSNITDMSRWLTFVLDSARVAGRALLQPATYSEWLRPQVVIPPRQFYPTIQLTQPHWTTYALGWFQHDYRGKFVSFHTGSLPGTTAIIGIMPEAKLGVYVFGNLDHAELRHALMYRVFDLFAFDDDQRDWSKEVKALYDKLDQEADTRREKTLAKRVSDTQPSKPLAAYAGDYTDPFYGKVTIVLRDDSLYLTTTSGINAELKHWHYNTFSARWEQPWRRESLVHFTLAPDGQVQEIEFDRLTLTRDSSNKK